MGQIEMHVLSYLEVWNTESTQQKLHLKTRMWNYLTRQTCWEGWVQFCAQFSIYYIPPLSYSDLHIWSQKKKMVARMSMAQVMWFNSIQWMCRYKVFECWLCCFEFKNQNPLVLIILLKLVDISYQIFLIIKLLLGCLLLLTQCSFHLQSLWPGSLQG